MTLLSPFRGASTGSKSVSHPFRHAGAHHNNESITNKYGISVPFQAHHHLG